MSRRPAPGGAGRHQPGSTELGGRGPADVGLAGDGLQRRGRQPAGVRDPPARPGRDGRPGNVLSGRRGDQPVGRRRQRDGRLPGLAPGGRADPVPDVERADAGRLLRQGTARPPGCSASPALRCRCWGTTMSPRTAGRAHRAAGPPLSRRCTGSMAPWRRGSGWTPDPGAAAARGLRHGRQAGQRRAVHPGPVRPADGAPGRGGDRGPGAGLLARVGLGRGELPRHAGRLAGQAGCRVPATLLAGLPCTRRRRAGPGRGR